MSARESFPGPVARAVIVSAGLVAVWQAIVWLSGAPHYILPGPAEVFRALVDNAGLLLENTATTAAEIIMGLSLGVVLGAASALIMDYARGVRRWLMPLLVVSQAAPVFALAPVLLLWFGYGMASKVAMATLIIYFPVTVGFLDGLRRTDPGWLDLARAMSADPGKTLLYIRVPAAMPGFASGLRVATAVAPIGAVVGEWVGSASGLGYLMMHASSRLEIDLMFAALAMLAVMAVTLYFAVDRLLVLAMPWLPDASGGEPAETKPEGV